MSVNTDLALRLLLKGTDKDLGADTVASVVITGICVVFIGLIILILCVNLYGAIFGAINRRKAEKAKAEAEAAAKQTEQFSPKPPPQPEPVVEDGIEEEVVAVIAAAIAAMGASSGKRLALRSIRTAKGSRSAWASAGIAENTRPF